MKRCTGYLPCIQLFVILDMKGEPRGSSLCTLCLATEPVADTDVRPTTQPQKRMEISPTSVYIPAPS